MVSLKPEIVVHENTLTLAKRLAGDIAAKLNVAIIECGCASLVLPGGSSPRSLITELARRDDLDWSKIAITTSDERCVDFDDAESNAGQITRLFEREGRDITPVFLCDETAVTSFSFPVDICVLGMGLDGHFASLFPGQDWQGRHGVCHKATAPNAPHDRISLSFETILTSRCLMLLAPGQEKQTLVNDVLEGKQADLPIADLIVSAQSRLTLHYAP